MINNIASAPMDGAGNIVAIIVLVVFILGTVVWLFSRYKMCPSDKILIVYGNVGAGRSAKCIHGGATFIMPIVPICTRSS